jgi:uncharacterized protein YdaU (DUF1376 family)
MVSFYKHDIAAWRGGTASLTHEQYRVYHVIVEQLMLDEGPVRIHERMLAGLANMSVRAFRKALDELVAAGKLRPSGDQITNDRAENELVSIRNNRENAKTGGFSSGKARREQRETKEKPNENNADAEAPLHSSVKPKREEYREEKKEPPNPLKGANGSRRHPWPDDWRVQIWTAYGKAVEKKPSMAAAEALYRADNTAWADLIGGINRQAIAVPDPTFRPALHRFIKNEKWTDNYATGPPRPQQSRWAI